MHPVRLSQEEVDRIKKAVENRNWRSLTSWKELYLYQRFCGNINDIKEIGLQAKKKLDRLANLKIESAEIQKKTDTKPDIIKVAEEMFT